MKDLLYRTSRTGGLVAFYFTFSISLTFYNKWLMKVKTVCLRQCLINTNNIPAHRKVLCCLYNMFFVGNYVLIVVDVKLSL